MRIRGIQKSSHPYASEPTASSRSAWVQLLGVSKSGELHLVHGSSPKAQRHPDRGAEDDHVQQYCENVFQVHRVAKYNPRWQWERKASWAWPAQENLSPRRRCLPLRLGKLAQGRA